MNTKTNNKNRAIIIRGTLRLLIFILLVITLVLMKLDYTKRISDLEKKLELNFESIYQDIIMEEQIVQKNLEEIKKQIELLQNSLEKKITTTKK